MPPKTAKILTVKTASLTPDPKNARRHSRRNLDEIRKSIEHAGFRGVLVVWASAPAGPHVVLVGNGRLTVLREMGVEDVRVELLEGWTEAEARDYAIRDNRTGELAEWDPAQLADAMPNLAAAADLGFRASELVGLRVQVGDLAIPPLEPPRHVPPVASRPATKAEPAQPDRLLRPARPWTPEQLAEALHGVWWGQNPGEAGAAWADLDEPTKARAVSACAEALRRLAAPPAAPCET